MKVSTFFQPKFRKSKESHQGTSKNADESSAITTDPAKTDQETLDTFIINSATTKTEMIWSLKFAVNWFSNQGNDELSETFAARFQSFSLARTRSMYTLTYVLAPHFKSVLVFALE